MNNHEIRTLNRFLSQYASQMPPLLYFMMNFVTASVYGRLYHTVWRTEFSDTVSAGNQNKLIKSKKDYNEINSARTTHSARSQNLQIMIRNSDNTNRKSKICHSEYQLICFLAFLGYFRWFQLISRDFGTIFIVTRRSILIVTGG